MKFSTKYPAIPSTVMTGKTCSGKDCQNTLAKTTRGEYCRKCITTHNTAQATALNGGDSAKSIDGIMAAFPLDTAIGQMKVEDLIAIIRSEMSAVLLEMDARVIALQERMGKAEEAIKENGEKVESLGGEVGTLKRVVLEQQKSLEFFRRKECSRNIIVSGVPNTPWSLTEDVEVTDDQGKLEEIFRHIDCSHNMSKEHKITSFPVQDGKDTHSLKIHFSDENDVKEIMSKAKELKTFNRGKIYINFDEPYYTRKENLRIRKKKYELIDKYKDDEIKILKGKLYHNNSVVDQFNLSNQIF